MNSSLPISDRTRRIAAVAIAATALLVMVALFHHPVASHHEQARDTHAQIAQLASADNLVHGALTAMLVVLAGALAVFGAALGARRPALSAALGAYGLGCGLLGVAMLFDGFVIPRLAAQFVSGDVAAADTGLLIMGATGVIIQVFSKAGLLVQCVAMLTWSYAAATSTQTLPGARWFAGVGALAALLPAAAILWSDLTLTRQSLMVIFAAHAVWYFAAAWLLYRSASGRRQT
jgi:uncharacterized membrane protein